MVATEEKLKYDICNVALFEKGQQFVDVHDYQWLMDENKEFKERITVLEDEMKMKKDAWFNILFEDEDVHDDRQIVNFTNEGEMSVYWYF